MLACVPLVHRTPVHIDILIMHLLFAQHHSLCGMPISGTKMEILNIRLKLQWNKLKGNDPWSEL